MRSLTGPRSMWVAVIVIVLLALATAGRGMTTIPLESHEIYVAQTAENMLESGDWLVPRLNGQYRLTKPPLSYWTVASITSAAGQTQVGPGVARLPSVFAVVGLALLALWIGTRLFDRRTGTLSALMCVASLAAFKYGHNARPDMFYAFWTTTMLAAWVGSQQAIQSRRGLWVWAMWLLFGMATLTKGPQAPVILLIGLLLHATLAGERPRQLLRHLRPLRGTLIVLVMVVPWYLLLRHAIGSETLGDSQLSGELLTVNPLRLLTSYYVIHSPLLWAPWALLMPAAVVCVWRDPRGPAGLLAFTIVFAMLAFALGPQYRQIYMLPWLAPAMLVFAATVVRVTWSRLILAVILTVTALAFGWLVYEAGVVALVIVAPGLLLIVIALWLLRHGRSYVAGVLGATALALGLFQGGTMPALWSSARYDELAFVQALSQRMDPDMPVMVWDIDPATYSYYLERPVKGNERLDAVCTWIGQQHATTLLIFPTQRQNELARHLTFTQLLPGYKSEFAATRIPRGTRCHAPKNTGV